MTKECLKHLYVTLVNQKTEALNQNFTVGLSAQTLREYIAQIEMELFKDEGTNKLS